MFQYDEMKQIKSVGIIIGPTKINNFSLAMTTIWNDLVNIDQFKTQIMALLIRPYSC